MRSNDIHPTWREAWRRAAVALVSRNTDIHQLCSQTDLWRKISLPRNISTLEAMLVWTKENPFHCLAVEMHRNPCRKKCHRGGGWNSIQLPIAKAKSVYVHYTSISRGSRMSQTWTSVFKIQIAVLCWNCVLNLPMYNWSNSTGMIFQKCDLCKRYEEVSITSLLCSTGILGHHLLQSHCRKKEWAVQFTTKIKAFHSLLIHTTFIDAI